MGEEKANLIGNFIPLGGRVGRNPELFLPPGFGVLNPQEIFFVTDMASFLRK
jgi:hypothetical protein